VADLRDNARLAAAAKLGVEVDAVEIVGDLAVAGDADVSLAELGASGVGRYEATGPTNLSFCAAVALVSVDRATGKVTLRRYTGAYDVGRAVNPLLVEGQIHGGVAQGIGQALMERVVFDEQGQLLTGSFMDYQLPRAGDLPDIGFASHPVPATTNQLGAKGCGEAGCAGSLTSVMNAVVDALSDLGIRHIDMPATPEIVWRAIQEARPRKAAE